MAGNDASRGVVLVALVANLAIAGLKLVGYLLTGSPSLLSETYHSLSDTGNQIVLLVGLRFAKREPSRQHPFGWGKAEFFYGFVVSMFLFFLAGWESLREGIDHLRVLRSGGHVQVGYPPAHLLGTTVPGIAVAFAILLLAVLFEGYSFLRARDHMLTTMARNRYANLWETFRGTKSASVLTAFSEDLMALVGLGIAALGLALSYLTGDPVFDALGALLIGAMLMSFALVLAWEQKRLLLGEAMEAWQEREIAEIVRGHRAVEAVRNLRTVYFGPDRVLLTADIYVAGDLTAGEADRIVDELNEEIRDRFPAVRTIYLETEVGSPAGSVPGDAAPVA